MSPLSGHQLEGPPPLCSSSTPGRPWLEWVGQVEGEGREMGEGWRGEGACESDRREGEREEASWRMLMESERVGLGSFFLNG